MTTREMVPVDSQAWDFSLTSTMFKLYLELCSLKSYETASNLDTHLHSTFLQLAYGQLNHW